MKIKKGDTVKVITGKDRGTVAQVVAVFPKEEKILVEGVNMKKKNVKPTQGNPDGGHNVEKEAPIHVSNVMANDAKAKTASRVGYVTTTDKDGKASKVRVYKKSGTEVKGGSK